MPACLCDQVRAGNLEMEVNLTIMECDCCECCGEGDDEEEEEWEEELQDIEEDLVGEGGV